MIRKLSLPLLFTLLLGTADLPAQSLWKMSRRKISPVEDLIARKIGDILTIVVKEDHKNPDLLFAGMERGLYVSFDGGDEWRSLQTNLPIVPITDLMVRRGDLVLARSVPRPRRVAVGTDADPILLEIFNNLFMSIAEQMGAALENTAYSVNIKERLDFSCAVFDAAGQLIANAPHMPVHLGSMSESVRAVISSRSGSMSRGDVYVLNNPYHGGTHLPDVTVITPAFAGDTLLGYLAFEGDLTTIAGLGFYFHKETPGLGGEVDNGARVALVLENAPAGCCPQCIHQVPHTGLSPRANSVEGLLVVAL